MRRKSTRYFIKYAVRLLALAFILSGCSGQKSVDPEEFCKETETSWKSWSGPKSSSGQENLQKDENGGRGGEEKEDQTESGRTEDGGEGQTEAEIERDSVQNSRLHVVLKTNAVSDYGTDSSLMLWKGSSSMLSVRDSGFEALNEALANYSNQRALDLERERSRLKEAAQEHWNGDPHGFQAYCTQFDTKILRGDQRVLSFQEQVYSYTGGAHGNVAVSGYTYDSQSGKKLELEDVVSSLDGLCSYLVQSLSSGEYREELFQGWEDVVRREVFGESANGRVYELSWALGPDGMKVYFSPYEIGPWALGTVTVTVPYEEKTVGIGERWTPAEEENVWQLFPYQERKLDVDGDKTEEIIRLEPGTVSNMEQMYVLWADGQSVEFNGTYGVASAWIMENSDGRKYFYGDCRTDNDYHYLNIVDLEELKERGADTKVSQFSYGMYGDIPMDAQSFWLSSRGGLFSTFPIRKLYSIGENGLPRTDDTEFTVDRWRVVAVQEISACEGSGFQKKTRIAAGTELFVTATDEKSRVTAETGDGIQYQFEIKGENWPHTIDGKNIEELFDGLIFAG